VCVVLEKVISGGQSGADRAALYAAQDTLIPTGGVAPRGFMTTEGRRPELGRLFGLKELEPMKSLAQAYRARSMKNVDDASATVAFRLKPSVGTDKTIAYCRTGAWCTPRAIANMAHRPCLVIEDLSADMMFKNAVTIADFVIHLRVRILNVCGHRDDATSGLVNFEAGVRDTLITAFWRLADHPYPLGYLNTTTVLSIVCGHVSDITTLMHLRSSCRAARRVLCDAQHDHVWKQSVAEIVQPSLEDRDLEIASRLAEVLKLPRETWHSMAMRMWNSRIFFTLNRNALIATPLFSKIYPQGSPVVFALGPIAIPDHAFFLIAIFMSQKALRECNPGNAPPDEFVEMAVTNQVAASWKVPCTLCPPIGADVQRAQTYVMETGADAESAVNARAMVQIAFEWLQAQAQGRARARGIDDRRRGLSGAGTMLPPHS